jgi:hypothetical protein
MTRNVLGGSLMEAVPTQRAAVVALRTLVVCDAVIFLSAASLHLGGRLVLGPLVLELGRIIPASGVERTAHPLASYGEW